MESYNAVSQEVSTENLALLLEFGFGEEESQLALKISQNNMEQAVELLSSGGADIESLRALANVAKITPELQQVSLEPPGSNAFQPWNFNMVSQMETKMVIVMRQDQDMDQVPIGQCAKWVSEAVIYAFQRGQEFDSMAIQQWMLNSWPKIVLKCKNEAELVKIADEANKNEINHYLLKKRLGADQCKADVPKQETQSEEAKEQEQQRTVREVPILCVVGPALSEKVNLVTGKLKLL